MKMQDSYNNKGRKIDETSKTGDRFNIYGGYQGFRTPGEDRKYEEGVMKRKVHENKSECERSGGVYVSSYRKADGTHVHSYCRGHGDDFKGMYEEDHRYSRRRK